MSNLEISIFFNFNTVFCMANLEISIFCMSIIWKFQYSVFKIWQTEFWNFQDFTFRILRFQVLDLQNIEISRLGMQNYLISLTWQGGHVGGQNNTILFRRICIKIKFSSQRRDRPLFLTTNMAAMTSRAIKQYGKVQSIEFGNRY